MCPECMGSKPPVATTTLRLLGVRSIVVI